MWVCVGDASQPYNILLYAGSRSRWAEAFSEGLQPGARGRCLWAATTAWSPATRSHTPLLGANETKNYRCGEGRAGDRARGSRTRACLCAVERHAKDATANERLPKRKETCKARENRSDNKAAAKIGIQISDVSQPPMNGHLGVPPHLRSECGGPGYAIWILLLIRYWGFAEQLKADASRVKSKLKPEGSAVAAAPGPSAIAVDFQHCVVQLNRFGILGESYVCNGVFIETPQYLS
jgi:hypothetical protein